MVITHLYLQRLADVETPLSGIKVHIRRFVVVQHVICIVRIVIRLGNHEWKFLVKKIPVHVTGSLVILATDRQKHAKQSQQAGVKIPFHRLSVYHNSVV